MPVKLRGGGVSDTTPSPTSPSQGGPLCAAAGASVRPRCRCAGPGNPPAMPPALLLRRRRSVKIWELQGQDQSTRCHPLDRSPRWTHTSSGSSFPSRCVALGRPGRARSRCLALALREALARASDPAARGHPSRQIAHGCSHEKNVRHHWMPMEKAACLALLVASATIDHGGQRLHVLFERERISSAGTACGSSCDGISGRRKRTPPRLLLGRR